MKIIYYYLLLFMLNSCLNGPIGFPSESDFRKEYLVKSLEEAIGINANKLTKNSQNRIEILENNNFAYHYRLNRNFGGWKTNCQYYYEIDKDTNIIVRYKITDTNPDKNCRVLGIDGFPI